MKIKIDKDYTSKKQEIFVKECIEDFKERFTENDLADAFGVEFGKDVIGEVLKIDVSAFASDYHSENTSFKIDIVLMDSISFKKLHFYLDEDNRIYTINTDRILWTYERYVISESDM